MCNTHPRVTVPATHPDPEVKGRPDRPAKRTGRTKTFNAREAILEHPDNLADIYLATQRLKHPAKTYSAGEVKDELGL